MSEVQDSFTKLGTVEIGTMGNPERVVNEFRERGIIVDYWARRMLLYQGCFKRAICKVDLFGITPEQVGFRKAVEFKALRKRVERDFNLNDCCGEVAVHICRQRKQQDGESLLFVMSPILGDDGLWRVFVVMSNGRQYFCNRSVNGGRTLSLNQICVFSRSV